MDPSPEEDGKGKMVVIRREDDHRTSHGERDELVGVQQTPGATTYYPLGGRNSPLKRLYSDNPTFPFLRLICPERRHFNTRSRRITRHKYGRIYASTTWKIAGVTIARRYYVKVQGMGRISRLSHFDRTYWNISDSYVINLVLIHICI